MQRNSKVITVIQLHLLVKSESLKLESMRGGKSGRPQKSRETDKIHGSMKVKNGVRRVRKKDGRSDRMDLKLQI